MNDTSPEIEKLQFEMIMKRSSNERIAIACEMFMAAREIIASSLPKNLSAREMKKQIFERTYGEPLPADFFGNEKE